MKTLIGTCPETGLVVLVVEICCFDYKWFLVIRSDGLQLLKTIGTNIWTWNKEGFYFNSQESATKIFQIYCKCCQKPNWRQEGF